MDRLTGYLRDELLQLDVDNVTAVPASEEVPPGARAVDVALTRHDLRSSGGLYTAQSATVTRLLTWTSKLLAIPALILAAVILIAYLIARQYA